MDIKLKRADKSDFDQLMLFVRAYHQFEGIRLTDSQMSSALAQLLEKDNPYGVIWLATGDRLALGYIAVTFGFSLEMAGRDAFVDEFFLSEAYRGQGFGKQILQQCKELVQSMGIGALHLEVDKRNQKLKSLYSNAGFDARDKYHLMTIKL